jgi:hypothetical protein
MTQIHVLTLINSSRPELVTADKICISDEQHYN